MKGCKIEGPLRKVDQNLIVALIAYHQYAILDIILYLMMNANM